MMTEEELNSYNEEFIGHYGAPARRRVVSEGNFKNAEKTGDREAYKGVSWIDYWRAMTGRHQTMLKCSSCGKEIIVGTPTLAQRMDYARKGETVDEHQAVGGHIWLNAPSGADWTGGRYITPLCPACNNKRGQQINLNIDSILCKELGAK